MTLKNLYKHMPGFVHGLFISGYNINAYRIRYKNNYRKYRLLYKANSQLSIDELKRIQFDRFIDLLKYAVTHSPFYKDLYKDIDLNVIKSIDDIIILPVIDKELLRKNIHNIYTIPKSKWNVSKTGGTTGKSIEVLCTLDNINERFALLDNFRSMFGYKLGKKTAWFSGKSLLTNSDINKNHFWKTDYYHRIRYYSTFHIKEEFIKYYIKDLQIYKPEYVVGFPSNIAEIARYGLLNNIDFPKNCIKVVFPTAETVTDDMRKIIEDFFNTKVYDQYSSSEGAPFISECVNNRLHMELQSGVFEVLDENNEYANNGRLVVTSFTTYGTPLIRYDIGDCIEIDNVLCTCGNQNPIAIRILGRIDDYIYSPENGKINLGNVSNTLKDTKGIIKFQVIQDSLNELLIRIVADKKEYDSKTERIFLSNWRDRVGSKMTVKLEFVDDIPVEKSGKFRMVKNNIKHLVEKT